MTVLVLHLSNCGARTAGRCTCGASSLRSEKDARTQLRVVAFDELSRLRTALEAVEWVEERTQDPTAVFEECPSCAGLREIGHTAGCLTAIALGRSVARPKLAGVDLGERHNGMGLDQ